MRIALLFLLFAVHCSAQSDTVIRIYFDFASWEPKNDPFRNLDTNKWERIIRLEGRTDTTGSTGYNEDLADFRLQAVREMLGKYPHFTVVSSLITGEDYAPSRSYRPEKERCVVVTLYANIPERIVGVNRVSSGQAPDPYYPAKQIRPRTFHPDSAMVQGDVFILRNIEFLINETVVTLESYPELQRLAKVMKDHPTMHIHIKGHVCCAPAQSLSYQRAMKVYTYLVSNGIEPERMTYEGYSNKLPNPEAQNDLYSQSHRRVEIEIIKE